MTSKLIGVKAGALVHPVRLACIGNPSGPSLYHLLEVFCLGKRRRWRELIARLPRSAEKAVYRAASRA